MSRVKQKRCRHENADHLMPGEGFGQWNVLVEQFRCLDCGAWLPLGPANDDDPRVKTERRAAELAALGKPVGVVETIGWFDCRKGTGGITDQPDERYVAGYLARCIIDHPERQE